MHIAKITANFITENFSTCTNNPTGCLQAAPFKEKDTFSSKIFFPKVQSSSFPVKKAKLGCPLQLCLYVKQWPIDPCAKCPCFNDDYIWHLMSSNVHLMHKMQSDSSFVTLCYVYQEQGSLYMSIKQQIPRGVQYGAD